MAGARVAAVGPDGSPITVPVEKVPELEEGGGSVISDTEAAATDAARAERERPVSAADVGDAAAASFHASERGLFESVGVPLDRTATSVADAFGGAPARKKTAAYLKGLDERHPIISTASGIAGNVAGAVGIAALLKTPGAVGAPVMAGARGVAARMAIGGVENVIQATTKDVNEAALGDERANAEMLVANMPKHLVVGSLLVGGFEGAANVLGKGVRAVTSRAVPALEGAATKAVGRELGEVGEEAAVVGARVRGLNGGEVPTSRAGIADLLTAEQGAQRARSAGAASEAADALAGAQTSEAALMSARQEAARKGAAGAGARGVAQAEGEAAEGVLDAAAAGGARVEQLELTAAARRAEVASVADHYGAIHGTLDSEHGAALRSLKEIIAEQDKVTRDLRTNIETWFNAEGPTVTKSAPRAGAGKMHYAQRPPKVGDLDVETGEVWTAEKLAELAPQRTAFTGSEAAHEEAERLNKLHEALATARTHAETHLESVEKAIGENAAQAKQEVAQIARIPDARPPVATKVASVVEAAQARVRQVEEETAAFVEKARGMGEKEVAKAEKRGAARIASAKADADAALAHVESASKDERAALGKVHDKQTAKLPAARTETDVDPLLAGLAKGPTKAPLVSRGAMWSAGMSVVHGNPVAAAGALAGSFVAGQARNHGNLLAARTLVGLSNTLSGIDASLRRGAASMLAGAGSRTVAASTNTDVPEKPRKEPTFQELSKRIIDVQANPLELEYRVREAAGHIALDAPKTYAEILATTQRAHAYLYSILPMPQRDPNTLTPHLDPGFVNETAQYDFMQSARTIDEPLSIFADVNDGSITQAQVQAIENVYPALYDRMRNEVKRQSMYLTSPVDYNREVHVGVLLGQVTNEVLEPDFQVLLRDTYEEKSEKAKSQNEGSGASGSKAAKNMMSASESVEGGL